jgi:hypothetical protein
MFELTDIAYILSPSYSANISGPRGPIENVI